MEKVALVKCKDYIYQDVYNSLKKAFDLIGGIDKYVKEGNKVLLKLNLVMKKDPREGATTHPEVARAMADLIKEQGATPIFADSPGGIFTEGALRGVYKACGIQHVAEACGAVLNYNTQTWEVDYRDGSRLKKLTLASFVRDIDVIISMPKLKTHGMTLFTGAVKNMFGTVPGVLKAQYHYDHSDVMDFCNALVDICSFVGPHLSVMDGILGMEGEGPTSGNPKKVGALLVSQSPFAIDTVAAYLIGINPMEVKTIKAAANRNIFSGSMKDIELLGDSFNDLAVKFDVPYTKDVDFKGNIPPFVHRFVSNLLKPKPVFIHSKCTGCRDCEKNCTAKIIRMENNRPRYKLNKCIRCFCCQELCPHKAVEIKRSSILKKIPIK